MSSGVLIISDNPALCVGLLNMLPELNISADRFTIRCSKGSEQAMSSGLGQEVISSKVKDDWPSIVNQFDLVISLHCKQLFPEQLVSGVKCINVHPGLNPYNRGWFPQVFAIMNGLPHGATIHEIDVELDHGPIIAQKEVEVFSDDTSLTVYNRVQEAELDLLKANLTSILDKSYEAFEPDTEGNLNMIKDYRALLELDMDETLTMKQAIDKLRALTHGEYRNAYFIDAVTGDRIYVTIDLHRESKSE
jgi:dTDP-4-amino-4,6-dideoxyglucose formyltransferase